jgi:hypothetical protein
MHVRVWVRAALATVLLLQTVPSSAQFVQQGLKLRNEEFGFDAAWQGITLALSTDGNTALVGAPLHDGEGEGDVGAALVYVRSGNAWSQQGPPLIGFEEDEIVFSEGTAVALSGDGNTAVSGGIVGGAFVFVRNGGVWSKQARILGTGAGFPDQQGKAVAISADGNTIIIGSRDDNFGVGAAWIFVRSGNSWSQQGGKLIGTGAVGPAGQGYSVALSANGNTALVGAPGDNNGAGAVWVFTRSGSTWSQQGSRLVPTGFVGSGIEAGVSVSLSADGNTAVIGAPGENFGKGGTWAFTRSGSTWTQQAKFAGTGGVDYPAQGAAVSLSSDGNTVIVGGPFDYPVGAAWVFTRSGNSWSQLGNKMVGTGSQGQTHPKQGTAVAMSGDGNTALIGGPYDLNVGGSVWPFVRTGVAPPAPSNVVATATANTAILVSWNAVAGTTMYDMARSTDGVNYIPVATTNQLSYNDDSVSPNIAYLYKVRTLVPLVSAYSAADLATSIVFTDPTLTAQKVKAVHFTQLRTAVNAVRALAGLSAQTFTDSTLTAGSTKVKRLHLIELRSAIDAARAALSLPAIGYARPTISAGSSIVLGNDLVELRNGVK